MGSKLTESISRAFSVMEAFSITSPRMTLQQIADRAGLPKATAMRYLRTLASLGYVSREADSGHYRLSPKILDLGFVTLASMELRQAAMPYLEELSRTSDQNVSLGILDKTEVLYVERIRRRHVGNIYTVGSRINVYRTSLGLALLAHMQEHELARLIEELLKGPDAVQFLGPKAGRLFTRLREVREKGYAVSDEQFIPGMIGIGAPVLDRTGFAEGAINITVLSEQFSLGQLIAQYAQPLVETAHKISLVRGFPADPAHNPARKAKSKEAVIR